MNEPKPPMPEFVGVRYGVRPPVRPVRTDEDIRAEIARLQAELDDRQAKQIVADLREMLAEGWRLNPPSSIGDILTHCDEIYRSRTDIIYKLSDEYYCLVCEDDAPHSGTGARELVKDVVK